MAVKMEGNLEPVISTGSSISSDELLAFELLKKSELFDSDWKDVET